jgi:hypothetical protein
MEEESEVGGGSGEVGGGGESADPPNIKSGTCTSSVIQGK